MTPENLERHIKLQLLCGEYMHLWCAIEAGDDDIINSEHNGD